VDLHHERALVEHVPAVAEDGTVYVGGRRRFLYAIDGNGQLRWKLRVGTCDPRASAPRARAATPTAAR
jgi:outer membrane protein assembly factor BamB